MLVIKDSISWRILVDLKRSERVNKGDSLLLTLHNNKKLNATLTGITKASTLILEDERGRDIRIPITYIIDINIDNKSKG